MKRKTYNPVFKEETIKYIEENQLSISEESKKFGVGPTALRRWCYKFKADPAQVFPSQGPLCTRIVVASKFQLEVIQNEESIQ